MKRVSIFAATTALGFLLITGAQLTTARGQNPTVSSTTSSRGSANPVTIPISIKVDGVRQEAELQNIDITVIEDGEPQTNLSIRARTDSPLTIAVLIQDDLVSSIGNEIKPLREFIRTSPRGSRMLVGYVRSGSLQVRQKFTSDLEKAGKALRVPLGVASAGPYNPYVQVIEAVKRFDSQPSGRRAILLVSDGLDTSRGVDSSSATQSIDLQRAITEAQRRGVAIYSFYAPSVGGRDQILIGNAQDLLILRAERGRARSNPHRKRTEFTPKTLRRDRGQSVFPGNWRPCKF